MPEPLTPLEKRVYHFLLDFLAENTYQPSIREIGKRFRIRSTKTVSDLLQSIAEKGYIERDASRSRGVRLVGFSSIGRCQPVPLYGKIAAGEPALLPDNVERHITLDRSLVPSEDAYMLKVVGDSMIGRGIHDGDLVMVNPSAQAADGDVIAARLADGTTVKTLRHRGEAVVLEPANPAERELVVQPGDAFTVLGVVSGVFRSFGGLGIPDTSENLPVS